MRELVLVRIDDRLIHGQVATQWISASHANCILIIDDELVKNPMMMRMLKAVAPPRVTVDVKSTIDAIDSLKQETEKDEKMMILVKVPQILESLIDNGIEIPKIVLGGMGLTPQRKKFNKNVSASPDEIECMKRIIKKGVPMYYQLVPSDKAVNVEKLF